ncbi:MAG: 50S ribosomal protein L9 [Candidatus Marinimicrobia bacterium]|nr:50S ribosomal protein L9 [Candidatus Neomarinimicrobiota bacterium]|tara:strand:- start:40043 stop:40495 length:453 start_codon:yes stop_codon:yes gene_type:complete
MKVILIQDVDNLGKMGDSVNVKDGYARNFLIPRNLALFASKENKTSIDQILKQKELKYAKERSNLEALFNVLNKLTLKFSLQAGEEGKLFGSVTSQMISDELISQNLKVDKKEIELDEPIKSVGSHKVSVNLGEDLVASIKIKVNEKSSS